jgi:hypothetical protein
VAVRSLAKTTLLVVAAALAITTIAPVRHGARAAVPFRDASGPEILAESIGAATAAIIWRIANTAEQPERMTDEALAEIGG